MTRSRDVHGSGSRPPAGLLTKVRRTLRRALTPASLVLAVVTAALWVWSHVAPEGWSWYRQTGHPADYRIDAIKLASSRGTLACNVQHQRFDSGAMREGLTAEWTFSRRSSPDGVGVMSLKQLNVRRVEFAGVSYSHYTRGGGVDNPPRPFSGAAEARVVKVPYVWIFALAALPAALAGIRRAIRRHGRRRLGRAGCCAICGYNLRATPHRCPECGAAPVALPGRPAATGEHRPAPARGRADDTPARCERLDGRLMMSGTAAPAFPLGGGSVTVVNGRTIIVGTRGADEIEVRQFYLPEPYISVTINGEVISTLDSADPPLTSKYTVRGLGGDDDVRFELGFYPLRDAIVLGGSGDDALVVDGLSIDRTRVRGGLGDDDIRLTPPFVTANDASVPGPTVLGDGGNDTIQGGRMGELIRGGPGDDVIRGGVGDDTVFGGGGDDTIHGERDDDKLFGGDGDDRLRGDRGADAAYGNAGRDALSGGRGGDVLRGGPGDDPVFIT